MPKRPKRKSKKKPLIAFTPTQQVVVNDLKEILAHSTEAIDILSHLTRDYIRESEAIITLLEKMIPLEPTKERQTAIKDVITAFRDWLTHTSLSLTPQEVFQKLKNLRFLLIPITSDEWDKQESIHAYIAAMKQFKADPEGYLNEYPDDMWPTYTKQEIDEWRRYIVKKMLEARGIT